jgi:hypothetical protein
MANISSQHLSKPVVHMSPYAKEYKKKLASSNVPDSLYEFLAVLYGSIPKGQWEEVSNDYTLLTSKNAITFADFLKENKSVFPATNYPTTN